jgi:hypothetical protein
LIGGLGEEEKTFCWIGSFPLPKKTITLFQAFYWHLSFCFAKR